MGQVYVACSTSIGHQDWLINNYYNVRNIELRRIIILNRWWKMWTLKKYPYLQVCIGFHTISYVGFSWLVYFNVKIAGFRRLGLHPETGLSSICRFSAAEIAPYKVLTDTLTPIGLNNPKPPSSRQHFYQYTWIRPRYSYYFLCRLSL